MLSPIVTTPTLTQTPGLDTFDFTTFDFTDPASWTKLGKAWEVSYGRLPSQEELMMFVTTAMSGGMMPGAGPAMTPTAGNVNPSWNATNQASRGQWNGGGGTYTTGTGQGRGGGFVGGRGPYTQNQGGGMEETDAVVLGGDDTNVAPDPPPSEGIQQQQQPTNGAGGDASAAGGLSPPAVSKRGQMIKVGDKWKWVKAGDPLPTAP